VEDPVGPLFINDVDAEYSFWLEGAALNEFIKRAKTPQCYGSAPHSRDTYI
jgi:hypothetical protein